MPVVKVRTRYQVTIPEKVRRQVGLEVGDYVEVEAQGSKIVIKLKRLVDKEDAWFWSKEWQKKEREADEAIKRGELVGPFETAEEALEALKKIKVLSHSSRSPSSVITRTCPSKFRSGLISSSFSCWRIPDIPLWKRALSINGSGSGRRRSTVATGSPSRSKARTLSCVESALMTSWRVRGTVR